MTSSDEWYERERAAFIAWWEADEGKKFSGNPTLAAGAAWFARAESLLSARKLTTERINELWTQAMKEVAGTFFHFSFVPGSPRPTVPNVFAELLLRESATAESRADG